jgi:hypothetical protein
MQLVRKIFEALLSYFKELKSYRRYRRYTMIPKNQYVANLALVRSVLSKPSLDHGCIIECGTWKGGMAAGLIDVGGFSRDYFFFDSFEGLPPAKEIDGATALEWQANTTGEAYYDNCRASVDDFMDAMSKSGIPKERLFVFKGPFSETLPTASTPKVAVLRLDGDWYDSTMECLNKFWDKVIPGGIIILDDYHVWDGCSLAVHDFLSFRKAPERIERSTYGGVAYLLKR